MTPTHRMKTDHAVCGRQETLIAAGTEVEVVHMGSTVATVKPTESVWQLVPVEKLEKL